MTNSRKSAADAMPLRIECDVIVERYEKFTGKKAQLEKQTTPTTNGRAKKAKAAKAII
jgi:hypothetical protein